MLLRYTGAEPRTRSWWTQWNPTGPQQLEDLIGPSYLNLIPKVCVVTDLATVKWSNLIFQAILPMEVWTCIKKLKTLALWQENSHLHNFALKIHFVGLYGLSKGAQLPPL